MIKIIKRIIFLSLMCFVVLSSQNCKIAYASGIADIESFNKLDGEAKYLGKDYKDNYSFDIEKTGIFDTGSKTANSIANTFFDIIRMLAYIVICIFYFAMSFDVGALISPQIDAIQAALNKSIFNPLFALFFAGTGIILAINIMKRNLMGAIQELAKVLGIVLLSYFVVCDSGTALSYATTITKSIGVSALVNINSDMGITNTKDFAAASAGVLWVELVHKPWVSMEFVGTSPSKDTIEKFLSTKPGSDERKALVKQFMSDNPDANNFNKNQGGWRIAFSIIYLVPFVLKCGVYLMVALVQLAFQVVAVLYLLLAVIVLLLAMVPSFGTNIIGIWLKKIFESQLNILLITFVMALLIKIDNLLYSLSGQYGWFIVLIFQTAIGVLIVLKRDQILSAFSDMQKGMSNPGYLKNKLNRSGNVYEAVEKKRQEISKRNDKAGVVNRSTDTVKDDESMNVHRSDEASIDNGESDNRNRPSIQPEEGSEGQADTTTRRRTINTDMGEEESSPANTVSEEPEEVKRPSLSGEGENNVVYLNDYQKSGRRRNRTTDRQVQDSEADSDPGTSSEKTNRPRINTNMDSDDDVSGTQSSTPVNGVLRWNELQEIANADDQPGEIQVASDQTAESRHPDPETDQGGFDGNRRRPQISSEDSERPENSDHKSQESTKRPVSTPNEDPEAAESVSERKRPMSDTGESEDSHSTVGNEQRRPQLNTEDEQSNNQESEAYRPSERPISASAKAESINAPSEKMSYSMKDSEASGSQMLAREVSDQLRN